MSGQIHELSSPQSLALSHDGRMVAVADTGNNRVRIYSAGSGRLIQQFGMRGRGNGQIERPMGVAWDPVGPGASEGLLPLLVLDEGRVQVFSSAGEFLRSIDVRGVTNIGAVEGHVMMYENNSVSSCILKK